MKAAKVTKSFAAAIGNQFKVKSVESVDRTVDAITLKTRKGVDTQVLVDRANERVQVIIESATEGWRVKRSVRNFAALNRVVTRNAF